MPVRDTQTDRQTRLKIRATKFRQNQLALKGRSASQRHTDRQTDTQTNSAENKGTSDLQSSQQTDRQNKRTKKLNVFGHPAAGEIQAHQTWHGDRGPQARSCTSNFWGSGDF